MKLVVYLDLEAESDEYRYVIKDKSVDITVCPNDDLSKLCKWEKLEEPVREFFREQGYFYDNADMEKYMYKSHNILQIENYSKNAHAKDIISFINRNNLNQFNKVIINLNESQYNEIDEFMNQDLPEKIVFKLPDNSLEISYDEYMKTVEAVHNITDQIKDLSPLEQIMYLYDTIRDRVYCEDQMDKKASRDLSSVLLGDKIVCLGYANIFNIALKQLGIKTFKETLLNFNRKTGHSRNIVYIDDSKYGINSISFFDLTFDSKRQENDDSFLKSYAYFARPLSYFKNKEKNTYHSQTIPFFELDENERINEINGMYELDDIKNNDFIFSMLKLGKLYNPKLNFIDFINITSGTINLNKIMEEYEKCRNLLEKEITTEVFAKCLVNVRKKQQEINSERFHLDFDVVTTTIYERFKPEISSEKLLLLSIFGEKFFTEEDASKITKKVLGKNIQTPIQKKKS